MAAVDPLNPTPVKQPGALDLGASIKSGVSNLVGGAGPMNGATGYTPNDSALVSKQLTNLLSGDSSYITRARTRAAQYSAGRGTLNSSMAAGAGESAAIDAALPIASQDAQSSFQAQRDNAAAANQFAMADNAFRQQGALTIYGTENANEQARLGRDFTAGENAADRSFRTGERIGAQDFSSSEAAAGRTFQTGEREASQTYNAGENALQRTFNTGERVASQDFGALQADLDRAQQLRVQQLQEGGMDARQAQTIAAQERSQRADQVFSADQRSQDRAFQTGERTGSQDYTTARDATAFSNRLTEIAAQTSSQLQVLDKQNGTNLYASYRSSSQAINDQYASAVQRIQESDMDPDVKAAQIANLQSLTESRQTFANTVFSNSPQWADQWAQFNVSWGNGP